MRPQPAAPHGPVLIDKKETARILQLGMSTVNLWHAKGILKRVNLPGRMVRFRLADVLKLANQ